MLPDSTLQRKNISATCSHKLQEAFLWAKDHGYENNCEQKGSSLAFHWRGLDENIKEKLQDAVSGAWEPLTSGQDLDILPFDGGIELRCAGMHKGDAVKQIIRESSEDEVIAYLGDDLTDEDAFEALKGRGLAVLVRESYRDTRADLWLRPPDELLDFLQSWYNFSTGK
jgi:trehalose-phosphatase